MMRALIFGIAVLLAGAAFAQALDVELSNPADEARARVLMAELRCMVCQNETIDASPSPFAAEVRAIVREQIVSGRSDGEIKSYLTARYGEGILYRPRVGPGTILLWLAPWLALLIGGGAVYVIIKRAARPPQDL